MAHRLASLSSVVVALLLCGTAAAAPWAGLSPGDQAVLRPFEAQWESLSAQQRDRLLRHAQRYHSLPPVEQERMRARLAEWAKMSPEQRETARRNYDNLRRLPPEEREALRRKWRDTGPSPLDE